jgi:putative serine protease PepD
MSVIDQTVVETEPVKSPAVPPPSPGRFRTGLIGTVAGLVLGGGLVGGLVYARTSEPTPSTPVNSTPAPVSTTPGGGVDVRAVLDQVQPAVASIEGSGRAGRSAGTGMVITPEGHVLTNAHVVSGMSSIRVSVPEKGTHAAELLGVDRANDIAVLKVQGVSGLPNVTLGKSADLRVGDPVIAVGNALALDGSPTVTTGIVSALNRSIASMSGLIQTDAAINSGNSGGPLFDSGGRVVGMNTAVAGGAQNIGFAIPIDQITPKLGDLKDGATPASGYLGVSLQETTTAGALIAGVADGSPAAQAGLQPGDLVVQAGDDAINSPEALVQAVRNRKPGDRFAVTYLRDGDRRTATVTLASL